MNKEKIKKEFFHYCCDLNMMFRDKKVVDKEELINIVNSNLFSWTKEYQNKLEKEMFDFKSVSEFCSLFGKFALSCQSYEDYYKLAQILFKIIKEENKCFVGLFIYFYDTVFYTTNITYKEIFKDKESLFEYYKNKDNDIYECLINITKIVLSKDVYKSNKYNTVLKLIE